MSKFTKENYAVVKEDAERGLKKFKYQDRGVFKEYLEEDGVKLSDYKAIKHAESRYGQEATKAAAEYAKEVLKKEKNLNAAIIEMPYGTSGSISVNVTREISGVNHLTGKEYRNSGINVKIKDGTISKSFLNGLKDDLTAALIK